MWNTLLKEKNLWIVFCELVSWSDSINIVSCVKADFSQWDDAWRDRSERGVVKWALSRRKEAHHPMELPSEKYIFGGTVDVYTLYSNWLIRTNLGRSTCPSVSQEWLALLQDLKSPKFLSPPAKMNDKPTALLMQIKYWSLFCLEFLGVTVMDQNFFLIGLLSVV